MNSQTKTPLWAWALAIIGTFLILALLAMALLRQAPPPPLDANRKAERAKALAEVRAAEAQALAHPDWIDKNKGIVRLPVDVAMERVLQTWQDPAAARAELVARARKAAVAPPPAQAKPGEAKPAEGTPGQAK